MNTVQTIYLLGAIALAVTFIVAPVIGAIFTLIIVARLVPWKK